MKEMLKRGIIHTTAWSGNPDDGMWSQEADLLNREPKVTVGTDDTEEYEGDEYDDDLSMASTPPREEVYMDQFLPHVMPAKKCSNHYPGKDTKSHAVCCRNDQAGETVLIHRDCLKLLRSTTERLTDALNNACNQRDTLYSTIDKHKETIKMQNKGLDILTCTADKFQATINKQSILLDEAHSRINQYRERINDAKKMVTLTNAAENAERLKRKQEQSKNKNLERQITKLEKALKKTRDRNIELTNKIKQCNNDTPCTPELKSENNALKHQLVNALEARDSYSNLEDRMRTMQSKLDESERIAQDFRKEANELRTLYNNTKESVNERDAQNAALKQANDTCTYQFTEISELYESEQKQRADVTERLEATLLALKEMTTKAKTTEDEAKACSTHSIKMTQERDHLRNIAFDLYQAIKYNNTIRLSAALTQFEDETGLVIAK